VAAAALRAGHRVTFAVNPDRAGRAAARVRSTAALEGAIVADPRAAVAGADLVLVALPFAALDSALPPLADRLAGRAVIDATNPVGPGLRHALGEPSGAERVAGLLPGAHIVKALNVYGAENLGGISTAPGAAWPLMPYAGDDPAAKAAVAAFLTSLGWEPLDVGQLSAALDLEHLALLWIRMVRMGGVDGHLVWSALRWTP
jgi:predicted dinucleotide-binding enzyme